MAQGDRWKFRATGIIGTETWAQRGFVCLEGVGWIKNYRISRLMEVADRLDAHDKQECVLEKKS